MPMGDLDPDLSVREENLRLFVCRREKREALRTIQSEDAARRCHIRDVATRLTKTVEHGKEKGRMGGCCDKDEQGVHEPLASVPSSQKLRRGGRRVKLDGGSKERWVSREARDYGSARKGGNNSDRGWDNRDGKPPRIVSTRQAEATIVRRPSPLWAGMLHGSSESGSEFSYSYSEKGSTKLRKESFSTLQFQNLVITRGLQYTALAPLKELSRKTCGFALQTMLQDRLRCVDYRGFGSVLSGDLEGDNLDKEDAWLLLDAVKAPAGGEREVRECVLSVDMTKTWIAISQAAVPVLHFYALLCALLLCNALANYRGTFALFYKCHLRCDHLPLHDASQSYREFDRIRRKLARHSRSLLLQRGQHHVWCTHCNEVLSCKVLPDNERRRGHQLLMGQWRICENANASGELWGQSDVLLCPASLGCLLDTLDTLDTRLKCDSATHNSRLENTCSISSSGFWSS